MVRRIVRQSGILFSVAVVCLMVAVSTALAGAAPAIQAVGASDRPVIDGRLVEACWQTPDVAGAFKVLRTKRLASLATFVRVAYDDDTLYVGLDCRDDQMGKLVANETKRDGAVYQDDCVEVFLAPSADPVPYYHFLVNAANTQRDDVGSDAKWNARWTSAVWRGPDRWSVEIAIPFRELPLEVAALGVWRVNFARSQQSRGEPSCWSPCASGFHEPARFGTLSGLDVDLTRLVRRRLAARLTDLARRTASCIRQVPADADSPLGRATRGRLDELTTGLGKLSERTATANTRPALERMAADIADAEQQLASLHRRMGRLRLAEIVRAGGGSTAGWAVCQVSTMTKLPADQPFEGKPVSSITVALAGNETDAAQVAIVPLERSLRDLRVSVTPLKQVGGQSEIPIGHLTIRRVAYVETRQPTAGAAYPPGRLPDPLLPNEPVDVPADAVQAFWLNVHAPDGTPAGTYRGELRIDAKGHRTQAVPVEVRVFGFSLPRRPALRTAFLLNTAYLSQRHGVTVADNTVPGWVTGLWSGADVKGRPNYYGVGEFEHALDKKAKHGGRQSVRITGKRVVRGTHEGPRASVHTGPISLEKGRSYRFTVWYRTEGLTGLTDAWLSGGLGGTALPPSSGWKQLDRTYTPKADVDVYVYLRNHAVGTVWFDDAKLVDTKRKKNLLPSPGFELPYGKTGADLLGEYRMSMLAHRISDADVARPAITVDAAGKVSIDWTDFDRRIQSYLDHGLNAFNVKWLRIGGGWGKVTTPTEKRARAVSAQIIAQTEKHLIEKGWIDLAYIYVFDEPGEAARAKIIDAFSFVHQHGPRLRPLLTYGYGATRPWTRTKPDGPEAGYAAYADSVDVHVPHIDCCDWRVLDRLRGRPQKELWHYVCISAKRPYPNLWAIDYTGVDNRVISWQLWRYRLTGTLYWCVNYWKQDVWRNPMSYPGGNGDGSLYYPGKGGPIESIRLELTRDGVDDYDYLKLLADLVADPPKDAPQALIERAKKLLDVGEVCTSFTEYATDPSVIEKRRMDLADAIEQLTHAARARK